MRSITNAEKAFVTQLVQNTRKLVSSRAIGLDEKIATIQGAVKQNSDELKSLRNDLGCCTDSERSKHLGRIILLRERATSYLVGTAKFLVHRQSYSATLRQMPRMFAYPDWQCEAQSRKPVDEYPFMEFSS